MQKEPNCQRRRSEGPLLLNLRGRHVHVVVFRTPRREDGRLRGVIVQNEANVKLDNPDLAGGCVAAPGFVIHVTKCGDLQRSAALCSAMQRLAAPRSAGGETEKRTQPKERRKDA
jgi:hypothetical protein